MTHDDRYPCLTFGPFVVDSGNRQLRRDGVVVELGSRYFDALALLVREAGQLVTKDRFMDEVWRGIPVTDEALTQCIRTLRRALGDDAANPRYIQTVPKHGYRFLAEVTGADAVSTAMAADLGGVSGSALPAHLAGACTLAGLAAGVLAGLIYGAVAGTGGGANVLILAAMTGALGLLAGAALGAGMAAARAWRRKSDGWLIAGAALAGLIVGALGNLLAREGIALLTGGAPADVTGPMEGLLLGAACGVAVWLALAGRGKRVVIATALLAGGSAGALIQAAGGTLLGGSLWRLQLHLPGMQLAMERLGDGSGFGAWPQGVTAIVEAAAFTLVMALGTLSVRRSGR